MKHFLAILATLCILSCGYVKSNEAVEYNNSLIIEQDKIADEINGFLLAVKDSISAEELNKKTTGLLTQIDNSIDKINEIGDFDGNGEFKETIINVLEAYQSGVKNEYSALAKYNLLPSSEQTSELYIEAMQKAYKADSIIGLSEDAFIAAQQAFASKYNVELEP